MHVDIQEFHSRTPLPAFRVTGCPQAGDETAGDPERMYLALNGICYVALGNDARGVAPSTFQHDVMRPPAEWSSDHRGGNPAPDWPRTAYPMEIEERTIKPKQFHTLLRHTAEEEIDRMSWGRQPRMLSSNEEARRLAAAKHFCDALIVLDDVMHVKVPEPTWFVNDLDEGICRLTVSANDAEPNREYRFRLDRLTDAVSWVIERDRTPIVMNEVHATSGFDSLNSDDALEISLIVFILFYDNINNTGDDNPIFSEIVYCYEQLRYLEKVSTQYGELKLKVLCYMQEIVERNGGSSKIPIALTGVLKSRWDFEVDQSAFESLKAL